MTNIDIIYEFFLCSSYFALKRVLIKFSMYVWPVPASNKMIELLFKSYTEKQNQHVGVRGSNTKLNMGSVWCCFAYVHIM